MIRLVLTVTLVGPVALWVVWALTPPTGTPLWVIAWVIVYGLYTGWLVHLVPAPRRNIP